MDKTIFDMVRIPHGNDFNKNNINYNIDAICVC